MNFEKDFDTLLNAILTDYRNQIPDVDLSQGSLVFIKNACLASAQWGIYKHQDWVAQQIFPDTADTVNLEHHCWTRGISRRAGETDAELLARLLDFIRHPPGGGNKYDYERWALEVDGVKAAWCAPMYFGTGTVAVVILASGDDEIPTQTLLDAVKAHIDLLRPAGSKQFYALAPALNTLNVTMTVTGSSVNRAAIAADIAAYMNSLIPGEALYRTRLISIAFETAGVTNVTMSVPTADVEPLFNQLVRPGVISVL
jgi:uncharacterized phage protein gp47/JayE